MSRRVVVTGASTGIGRSTVAALVAAGFEVWPTVRKESDAASLREEFGAAVHVLSMDVTDGDSVLAAGAEVRAAGPLYGLVNNAGAAVPGPLELLPLEDFRRQLEINLTGQLAVTQAMLPALRATATETADARIVMIGSVGGRIAGPVLGAYQVSKHGLVALASTFRAELAPSGIKVVLVEPGAIATPIWRSGSDLDDQIRERHPEAYARYARQIAGAAAMARRGATKGLPPEAAARVVVDALTRANPRPRVGVGLESQVIGLMTRVLPYRAVYRLTAGRE